MAQIEIYTSPTCGYCHAAKRLLATKQAAFTEIDIAAQPAERNTMLQRANGRTSVPQIFIDGAHIGGFDDLAGLERQGKLDPLLAG